MFILLLLPLHVFGIAVFAVLSFIGAWMLIHNLYSLVHTGLIQSYLNWYNDNALGCMILTIGFLVLVSFPLKGFIKEQLHKPTFKTRGTKRKN